MNLLEVEHPPQEGCSIIIYEDKSSKSSLEVHYEPTMESLSGIGASRRGPVLALAYFIKYPEAKHKQTVTITSEEAEQVVAEMNLVAIEKVYEHLKTNGTYELTSSLDFYE
ncbi:hypothetical protein [Halobacillus sp. Marseille-Q1614]|uniref:hypothetical protein n=1 Tax=Halobacillus sp. Marseille-Q1614 TaxID=2709134 RepID=UPI00156D40AD|nr:hypothetical protein [Halobacillus sp. Marseille-Q1614]